MTPYWILFIVAAVGALTERARKPVPSGIRPKGENLNPQDLNASWWLITLGLSLFIGLRHEVGGDWGNYLNNLANFDTGMLIRMVELSPVLLLQSEPAYWLLEWLAHESGTGIYLVNTLGAGLFAYCLARFCRDLSSPWLALLVSIPYLVVVVALGYTRQAIALGFVMLAFCSFVQARIFKACLYVFFGALFHKSAFAMIPLLTLIGGGNILIKIALTLGVIMMAALGLFRESLLALSTSYIEAAYQSEGALVRLSMSALAALLLLLNRRRFPFTPRARALWVSLAYLALAALLLYFVFPSSTAIDRIALYLIPLQVVVLSHVPLVYGGGRHGIYLRATITLYLASVLAVWLFFATHAYAWVPYRSVMFLALWD